MYQLIEQDGLLRIESYPIGLAMVAGGFIVAVLGAAVAGVADDPVGLAIGVGVPFLFLTANLQRRVTIFDPRDKAVYHESRSLLFKTRDDRYPLSGIVGVEIFRGSGNHGHFPALKLGLAGDRLSRRTIVLAEADILPGHAKRIVQLKDRVSAWLEQSERTR